MKEQTEKRPLAGFFGPWLPGVAPSQIKKKEKPKGITSSPHGKE
jgi:hypothetical protein